MSGPLGRFSMLWAPISRSTAVAWMALLLGVGATSCGEDKLVDPGGGGGTADPPPEARTVQSALQLFMNSPDPLTAVAAYERTLDSLVAERGLDSLWMWTGQGTTLALEGGMSLAHLDSISRFLADSGALDEEPINTIAADVCGEPAILYVNGMNTTFSYYLDSKRLLKNRLHSAGIPWRLHGHYNVSATDAEKSIWGGKICPIFGLLRSSGPERICRRELGYVVDLLESANQVLEQFIPRWATAPTWRAVDAQKIATKIERLLQKHRGVILLAHSQGNLMVNQAVEQLLESGRLANTDRLRLLRLGSPIDAGPVTGRARIDVCRDRVSWLSFPSLSGPDAIPGCLMPPTVSFPSFFPNLLDFGPHDINSSYLTGERNDRVMDKVRQLGASLYDAALFRALGTSVVPISDFNGHRIGIAVAGTVSCLPGTRTVRLKVYRSRLRDTDPRAWTGLATVGPTVPSFNVKSGEVESCESYIVEAELQGGEPPYPKAYKEVLVGDVHNPVGSADDFVYIDSSVYAGDVRLRGNIRNDRADNYAETASVFVLENPLADLANRIGWHHFLMSGNVDGIERFEVHCDHGTGLIVGFTGSGTQEVGIFTDKYREPTIHGKVNVNLLDSRAADKDVATFTFTPDSGDEYAGQAITDPVRVEFPKGAIRIILGY